MKSKKDPETLYDALKRIIQDIKDINKLEQYIDEKWGVTLVTGFIPSAASGGKGEVHVRRGMELIEEALEKKAKPSVYSRYTKELSYLLVQFTQYANDRTKTFVKAGKNPPKVQIVEEE